MATHSLATDISYVRKRRMFNLMLGVERELH